MAGSTAAHLALNMSQTAFMAFPFTSGRPLRPESGGRPLPPRISPGLGAARQAPPRPLHKVSPHRTANRAGSTAEARGERITVGLAGAEGWGGAGEDWIGNGGDDVLVLNKDENQSARYDAVSAAANDTGRRVTATRDAATLAGNARNDFANWSGPYAYIRDGLYYDQYDNVICNINAPSPERADTLFGSQGVNEIDGRGGDDRIRAKGGDGKSRSPRYGGCMAANDYEWRRAA